VQPCTRALPGSLARQPCPAALPGSLAQQPCLAALPGSLARQPCLCSLVLEPCPAALPGSLARQPCLAALPSSLAWQPCPAALPGSLARQPCRKVCKLFYGRACIIAYFYSAGSFVQVFPQYGTHHSYVLVVHTMIIIVYGSILGPFSNNRAASVGCQGRQLRPIFADWLCQLPTLPLSFSRVS
jgi:hypothetical protein